MDNFKITKDATSKKWQMEIIKGLNSKTLDEKTELLITMTVEESGKTSKGTSVLVLKLPPHDTTEKALKFKKEFYVAMYPKSGTGTVDFDSNIEFIDLDNSKEIKINVKGRLEKHFVVKSIKLLNFFFNYHILNSNAVVTRKMNVL